MKLVNKTILNIVTFLSIFLIIFQIISIFFGTYYLGDTVSYFEFASVGGPLTTFIIHQSLWTPLFSLILNISEKITLDPIFLASLTTFTFLSLSSATVFGLFKNFGVSLKKSLIIIALSLLTGHVSILMQTYMSEPLMITLVLLSLFMFFKFWRTAKEFWLILFVLFSALVPLARYLGAPIIVWLSFLLFVKLLLDLKSKKKFQYSPWLLIVSLAFIWVPIGFYMFKTKVVAGSFMGVRDLRNSLDLSKLALKYLLNLWNDLYLLAPITLLVGLTTKTKDIRRSLFSILVFLGSAGIYLLGLFYSETRFFVDPHLPSRYIAISYPFLVFSLFIFGSVLNYFFTQKVGLFKKLLPYFKNVIYTSLILFLSVTLFTNYTRLSSEGNDINSVVTGVYSTRDLDTVCDNNLKQSIFVHDHSRNWILKSYFYFCDRDMNRINLENDLIEKGSRLISAYKLENSSLEQIYYIDADGYDFYVYDVKDDFLINIEDAF